MVGQRGGSVTVNMAPGTIVVNGASGQSVEALADIIDGRIIRAVRIATGRPQPPHMHNRDLDPAETRLAALEELE